jgi:hypothetical protein
MTSDRTRIKLEIATADDVSDLVSLRAAVNQHLIAQFGKGYWASGLTEKGVLFAMKTATVYTARDRNRLIATVTLSTCSPGPSTRNISARVRSLCISPRWQAIRMSSARGWASSVLRTRAGSPGKCGFREVGRATYRNSPLIYFEMVLARNSTSFGIT